MNIILYNCIINHVKFILLLSILRFIYTLHNIIVLSIYVPSLCIWLLYVFVLPLCLLRFDLYFFPLIINQHHQSNPISVAAWESGLLSSRHGYCNRWRQSHSRWPLQGKLLLFLPLHTSILIYTHIWIHVNTFDVYKTKKK